MDLSINAAPSFRAFNRIDLKTLETFQVVDREAFFTLLEGDDMVDIAWIRWIVPEGERDQDHQAKIRCRLNGGEWREISAPGKRIGEHGNEFDIGELLPGSFITA